MSKFGIKISQDKVNVIKHTLGVGFLALGVLLVALTPLGHRYRALVDYHFYIKEIQAADNTDPIQIDENLISIETSVKNYPNRILIPKSEIDLEIKPANVVKGKWEVFDDKAGFGMGSATPEEMGNSVIFAHAKEGQFLNLKNVKPNDEILVFTHNNWFSYKVNEIKEVKPTDVSVIAPTDDSTLTLFTCSGFADSKRLIVVAKKVLK